MSEGFSAFVGNPPWVSYAGKAAQPLDDGIREYFDTFYASFAGYKNLQGVFIERCATKLRAAGRLGFVVPSSMSEQTGYRPTRAAHDRFCECDAALEDLGEDAFSGVFQPSMVLRSTRREAPLKTSDAVVGGPWPVERPDLDDAARALIAKMSLPPLPPNLFGERGLQSSGDDTAHMTETPDASHSVPLRVGGDILPFQRAAPSLFADPAWFGDRLRTSAEWREVRLLIRQTARVPLAVISDGEGFRNSILAGFANETYSPEFLVAYLNSTPIRWLHYMRHRDARQGMPQMKIGHLRAIPAPPRMELAELLAGVGAELSALNAGANDFQQDAIDSLVADMFGLTDDEKTRVRAWWKDGSGR